MMPMHGGAPIWVTGSYDPETESDLLGHGESRSGLGRRCAGWATTCTARR